MTIIHTKHEITKCLGLKEQCEIHSLIFNCRRFIHLKEQNRLNQLFIKFRNMLGGIFVNTVAQAAFFNLSIYFRRYLIIKFIFQLCTSHLFLILNFRLCFSQFFEMCLECEFGILAIIILVLDLLMMYILFYSPLIC